MSAITSAPIPPDSRLQAWRSIATTVETRWKASNDPNAQWTPWAPFSATALPAVQPLRDMAAGVLSDGRTQLWGVGNDGRVYTTSKVNTTHASPWTAWSLFNATGTPPGITRIAVAALPDKRLQLFITDNTTVWSAWQTPTGSWTSIQPFM
jgi:hypothetical protein